MKTTIKSIRMEKFEGQFTGKVIVTIADDILGFVRTVDADGVIEFKQDNVKQMRMQLTALVIVLILPKLVVLRSLSMFSMSY